MIQQAILKSWSVTSKWKGNSRFLEPQSVLLKLLGVITSFVARMSGFFVGFKGEGHLWRTSQVRAIHYLGLGKKRRYLYHQQKVFSKEIHSWTPTAISQGSPCWSIPRGIFGSPWWETLHQCKLESVQCLFFDAQLHFVVNVVHIMYLHLLSSRICLFHIGIHRIAGF